MQNTLQMQILFKEKTFKIIMCFTECIINQKPLTRLNLETYKVGRYYVFLKHFCLNIILKKTVRYELRYQNFQDTLYTYKV